MERSPRKIPDYSQYMISKWREDGREVLSQAIQGVKYFAKMTEALITQNRILSSILTVDGTLQRLTMSWRLAGEDVSTAELVQDFQNSGDKEILLYVPGLFTDESLWRHRRIEVNGRRILSRGIADYLGGRGYYPAFVRFNHGLHISENGEKLLTLVRELQELLPRVKIHILAYSLGALIVRSLLYQARKQKQGRLQGLGKIVFIASPDKGSYLEKFGFWIGFLMERAPIAAISLIGRIGNFRSDAIKDLSHGIIRKEDWTLVSPFFREGREYYFGELDGEDFYQAYGIVALPQNPHFIWMGDGVVEIPSLRYLNDRVISQLENPSQRILEVHGANHFTILNSGKLFRWLDSIFPPLLIREVP